MKQDKNKNNTIALIAKFSAAYPYKTMLMLICLVFSGVVEGVGLAALLPTLELIGNSGGENESILTSTIFSIIEFFGVTPSLEVLLVFIVIAIFIKSILLLLALIQSGFTIYQVMTDLRKKLIQKVLGAKWDFFISNPLGVFANAISTEATRASTAYLAACLIFAEIIQVIIYSILAFFVSPGVTLIVLITSPIIMLVFLPLIKIAKRSGEAQTTYQKNILAMVTDSLQGIKPIKAMGKEGNIEPILMQDIDELNDTLRRQVVVLQALKTQQEPIIVTGIVVILFVLINNSQIVFSELIILCLLYYRMIGKFTGLQKRYQTLVINQSAYWSLVGLTDTAHEGRENYDGSEVVNFNKKIEFKNVCFKYGSICILENVSFEFPESGFVVIEGSSGAGKTTVIDLLIGLLHVESGEILVDDIPIDRIELRKWREQIGYVPQEMTLFHDSLKNNLTLRSDNVKESDVSHVLSLVGLEKIVSMLSDGLNTIIGEKGQIFSGGQRQRLSIARALVNAPKILILDEVTNSLDSKSEAEICETLKNISQTKLVIFITHQVNVLKYADHIYHVGDGKVSLVRSK